MTDNEIIKALECCLEDIANCDNCPYEHYCSIHQNNMLKDTLSLINRQQAEIEKINNHIHEVTKTIKSEAINSFAKKLKAQIKSYEDVFDCLSPNVINRDIDNLVKEMVGDNNVSLPQLY